MSEFYAIRRDNALYPDADDSQEEFEKIPLDKAVRVVVRQPRSLSFHRLYWGLCHRIGKAVGAHHEAISDLLKIRTGHCWKVKTKSGIMEFPKSIAFSAMEQTDFADFFERCVQVIYEEFGIIRPDVLEAVSDLLTPTEVRT